ncbi:MAG TPA: MFS transporter [Acidobacteriota bacterium]|nr:MFS transporter [Acidobacteriota bacterium]HNB70011.1 MFS transporter [Acidobacteriota bacterium]HNC43626.1 MFS transporter [Acidobacteriota bacterium]HNG91288.1 MFS transporter [Acidobacteriota bacterium]HNH82290.1 MFS transporter [Acidobacteriota bacterium]
MSNTYAKHIGYLDLLRRNPKVRRLWMAQVVSELGDWLNFVALVQIINHFTPNAQAIGWLIVIQMIPMVVVGPFAGIIADRFNRCGVMIVADLVRAAIVLGYLTIDRPEELWRVYVLAALQFSVTAFFEPARAALIPSLAEGDELVASNALTSVTWSVMLALGGFLGGLITGFINPTATFLIDFISFIVSALLLIRLLSAGAIRHLEHKPESPHPPESGLGPALVFLAHRPQVLAAMLIKTGICITAGGLWLLSVVYGQRVFPVGKEGALSVGLLYGVHGLGSIVGASLSSRMLRTGRPIHAMLWAFVLRTAFFYFWAKAGNLTVVSVAIIAATSCGALLWVLSTTVLQELVPDQIRGRIFSLENSAMTFGMIVSTVLTGRALDIWHLTPQATTLWTAVAAAVVAVGWGWVTWRWEKWRRAKEYI